MKDDRGQVPSDGAEGSALGDRANPPRSGGRGRLWVAKRLGLCTTASNKPNSRVFGLKMRSELVNRPNFHAEGRRARPALPRGRRSSAPNKANPGRGDLGIDDGLRIIDDVEPRTLGAVRRQTNPMCLVMRPEGPADGASGENALRPRIKSGAGSPCEGRGHYERVKQSQFQAGGGRPEAGAGLPTTSSLQSSAWKRSNKANSARPVPRASNKPNFRVLGLKMRSELENKPNFLAEGRRARPALPRGRLSGAPDKANWRRSRAAGSGQFAGRRRDHSATMTARPARSSRVGRRESAAVPVETREERSRTQPLGMLNG